MGDPTESRTSRKPNTRLVMISAALGAALVLLISALLNWPTSRDGSGSGSSGGVGSSPAPPAVFDAQAGTCLNWTAPDASDMRRADCAQPHLFEVSGKADLRADFPDTARFPDAEQWQQLKQQRCADVSKQYLDQRFDPNGRFRIGAFTPSADGWAAGDRTVHCGLQQPGASGRLYRMSGPVGTLDQSDAYPAGRCLGINGTTVWDPVDCDQPHAVEITGQVDLAEKFPGGPPAADAQDEFLATRCGELTGKYAGGPAAVKDKGLVAYWDTLSTESWNAGSRQVNCKVSAQLPDHSALAAVTGSVRGPVRVAKEPAPENAGPAEPGVPANGAR